MHFVFQPLIDVAHWAVFGFEALTRFGDSVSPELHFRNAHAQGRLTELELRVIQGIIQSTAALPSDMLITLNASGPTIEALAIAAPHLSERLRWGLELNEQSAPCHCNRARKIATSLGCLLLVDDAGVAHANRARILELTPDIVKLDRTMLSEYHTSAEVRDLVQSLLAAAQEAGAKTLAEGVETTSDLQLVRDLGCDYAQGYYFAPGYPADQIPQTLTDLQRRLGINIPSF